MTCKCCFYHRRRRRPTKPRPIPLRARPRPKPINLRVVNEGMRRPRRHRLAGLHRPHPPPVIGPKLRGPVPFNFGISSPPFSFHNASLIYSCSTLQQFICLIQSTHPPVMINTIIFCHMLLISSQKKVYLCACPLQILRPLAEHLVTAIG